LLGSTLRGLSFHPRIVSSIAYNNAEGLPAVYNRAIRESEGDEALVFVHDDVFVNDFYLFVRIREGLEVFDVLGIAGNTNPHPNHVTWIQHRDKDNVIRGCNRAEVSGIVAHMTPEGIQITAFHQAPKACVLLDGCFIAADSQVLRERGIFFDEQFKFHFYDLDFCRTCKKVGLDLGTWPIAVTHASLGNFFTPEWEEALAIYRRKWGSAAIEGTDQARGGDE